MSGALTQVLVPKRLAMDSSAFEYLEVAGAYEGFKVPVVFAQ